MKIKQISSLILAFILAVSAVTFSLTLIIRSTILNQNYCINIMQKSNYYTNLTNELKSTMYSLSSASGVDKDFFDKLLDTDMIKDDLSNAVSGFYSGEKYNVKSEFKDKMYTSLLSYAKDKDIYVDDEIANSISYLSQKASEAYDEYINVFYYNTLSSYVERLNTLTLIALISILILILLIMIILLLMFKHKHKAIRAYIYSFSASFLILILIPITTWISDIIYKINFTSRSLYDLATCYMNEGLWKTFYISFVFLVLSVIFYIIYVNLREKAIHKKHKKHKKHKAS